MGQGTGTMKARSSWFLLVLAAAWLLAGCMPDRKGEAQILAEAAAKADSTALADGIAGDDSASDGSAGEGIADDGIVDAADAVTADTELADTTGADDGDSLTEVADTAGAEVADTSGDATAVVDAADASDTAEPVDSADTSLPGDVADVAPPADATGSGDAADGSGPPDTADATSDAADANDGQGGGADSDASAPCTKDADCSSGNACQVAHCVSGSCVLTAVNCDDGNVCTVDSCATTVGCGHVSVADGSACTTGSPCTLGDSCQTGVCTSLPAIWDKAVGTKSEDHLVAVDATAAGVVAVGSSNHNGLWEAWLVWVDNTGKVVLNKTFGGSGEAHSGTGIATLADGSFALAVGVNANNKLKARLLHVSVNGNLLAEATFMDVDPQRVAAVPGGGAVLVGRTVDGASGRGWAARVDAGWGKVWEKEFGDSSASSFADLAIANSMIWMVGTTPASLTSLDQAWVVRTDLNGAVQLEKTLSSLLPRSLTGVSAAALGGEIIAVGRSTSVGDAGLVLRVDASGAVKSDKEFSSGSSYFQGVAATFPVSGVDGGALAVGVAKPGSDNQLWLTRTQQTGYQAWQKTMGGSGAEQARDVLLQAHTLWIVGDTSSIGAGGSDGWILRLDVFGNASCATSGPCVTIGQAACDDGIPCTADICTAATYADKCAKGGCDAYVGCASSAISMCTQ